MAALSVIDGITHTRFVDNSGIIIDASCVGIIDVPGLSLLNLRSMDPPSQITTLNGRLKGTKLDLSISFFNYNMRRKAEALQYRKNQAPLSKKQQYAASSKSTSGSYYYSSKDLTQNLVNKLNCPNLDLITRPPSNSGVNDIKFPGYKYDISIPYLPSL